MLSLIFNLLSTLSIVSLILVSFSTCLCFIRSPFLSLSHKDICGQYFRHPRLAHIPQRINKTPNVSKFNEAQLKYGTVAHESRFLPGFPISELDSIEVEMSLMQSTTRTSRMIAAS